MKFESPRARPPRWVWLAGFLVILVGISRPLGAQVPEPTPTDTIIPLPIPGDTAIILPGPADTIPLTPTPGDTAGIEMVEGDTVVTVPIPPDEVAGDTVPLALREAAVSEARLRVLPEMPEAGSPGWAEARWEWTADELSRLTGMTLLEFLQQIPGVARFRAGGFGRPEGVTALGAGGGRVRVLLDGFELDPHESASFPLESMSLLDVSRIRVHRSFSEIRVEVESFRLETPEPYSVVELGTGAFQTRLLRAIFSRGFGERSVGTGAFDIVSTGGIGIDEPYRQSNTVLRWGYALAEDTGLGFEWRRTALDRQRSDYPQQLTRSDFIFRARRSLTERLTMEALAGRSVSEDEALENTASLDPSRTLQGALRGAYTSERLRGDAALRARSLEGNAAPMPRIEGEAHLSMTPFDAVRIEASGHAASGADVSATNTEILATVTPFRGLSVFGSAAVGSRLVPYLGLRPVVDEGENENGDAERTDHLVVSSADGVRMGAEVSVGGGMIGVAGFRSGLSPIVPFGLPFDKGAPLAEDDPITGGEIYFRLPVPRTGDALRLEGWYTRMSDVSRPYTLTDQALFALVFDRTYYEGQLRPTLRIEGVHRGSALTPSGPDTPYDTTVPGYQTLNVSLNIQILDVRAFLLWENVLYDETALDLPGLPDSAPRIVYGANWRFSN